MPGPPAFRLPVGFVYRQTSGMGDARPYGSHEGIDLAPVGKQTSLPIRASAAGVVQKVGWDPAGYGRYVVVQHPGGWRTLYGHMSSASVSPGQHVGDGATLGIAGSTGFSTGTHLHFSVINPSGQFVNPVPLLQAGASTPVSPASAATVSRNMRSSVPATPVPRVINRGTVTPVPSAAVAQSGSRTHQQVSLLDTALAVARALPSALSGQAQRSAAVPLAAGTALRSTANLAFGQANKSKALPVAAFEAAKVMPLAAEMQAEKTIALAEEAARDLGVELWDFLDDYLPLVLAVLLGVVLIGASIVGMFAGGKVQVSV